MKKMKPRLQGRRLVLFLLCLLWGGTLTANAQKKAWAKYDDSAKTLTFYYSDKGDLSADEFEYELNALGDEGNSTSPGWLSNMSNVTKVMFDESFAQARPTTCYQWFFNGTNISSIEGIKYLNTSEVKDMSAMFFYCTSLTNLDLSSFDTQNVKDMSDMFGSCWEVTNLNLSSFNTENVTNMGGMFIECRELTNLDLSSFNTQSVTDMSRMFYGCFKLVNPDLSSFNTQNVTNMSRMFLDCWSITNPDLSKFDTQNVTDMSSMFWGCNELTNPDLSKLNTQNVTDMSEMFYGCSKLAKLDLSSFNTQNVTNMSNMFRECSKLTNLDLSSFNTQNVANMSQMFLGCRALTNLDLSSFNTQNVTDMSYMFSSCSKLTEIYTSDKFTTDEVADSYSMFKDCTSLKGDIAFDDTKTDKTYATIDGGYFMDKQYIRPWVKYADGTLTFQHSYKKTISNDNGEYELNKISDQGYSIHPDWVNNLRDVTKVVFDPSFADARPTTCYDWFLYGEKIKVIEGIEYLNTQEVTDMNSMFFGCSALTELNLSNFNTSKVKDMNGMFYRCSALTELNLSNFNTSKVKGMYGMFYGCSALTKLDLSNFDTQEVTDMNSMFFRCSALTELNLSNFNTSKVKNMSGMFKRCSALTTLDLSNFDTQIVTDMKDMFNSCAKLKSLYLGVGFKRVGTDDLFSTDAPIIYSLPSNYAANKADFIAQTVTPYVPINAQSEYGTICVPLGSKLATDSYTGFDKLFTVKAADPAKGTVTLEEATSIEPGVAYVYHRALADDADKSVITFEADDDATAATAPANDGNLLKGTFERITAPGGSYILQTDGDFHPVAAGNTTLGVGAYRAYLDLSSLPGLDITGDIEESNAFRIVFDNQQATAIAGVSEKADNQPKAYFDLSGRKVTNPQRGGIYIYNGRKIIY